jgi:DNA-binding transcriptional MocR family regulator
MQIKAEQIFGYRRIAESVRAEIADRALPAGTRFLSVRRLAAREAVSMPTALAALRALESEGVIVARPRSGWFVADRPQLGSRQPSVRRGPQDVTIGALARQLFALRDRPLIPLGAGVPQADWLPAAELGRALSLAARRLGGEAHGYSYPPGDPDLRARIASRLAGRGTLVSAEEVIVTAGSTQGLELALQATASPGSVVGVETPTYFGTLLLLERLGLKALELPTHPRLGLDVEAARALIAARRPAALIASATLHNPTGATMPLDARRQLVAAMASHGVPVIEDDTYGELAEPGAPPLKAFDTAGMVLHCASVSKTLAPGWRTGWIAPGRYREAVLELRVAQSLAGSRLTEAALAAYLGGGAYDRHLVRLRGRIGRAARAIVGRVVASFPPGTHVNDPGCGYLLWIELPHGVDGLEVMQSAAEAGIAVAPGAAFSASGGLSNYLRINMANDPSPRLLASLDRLGALCAAQADRCS